MADNKDGALYGEWTNFDARLAVLKLIPAGAYPNIPYGDLNDASFSYSLAESIPFNQAASLELSRSTFTVTDADGGKALAVTQDGKLINVSPTWNTPEVIVI